MNDKKNRSLLDWFKNLRIGNLLNVNVGGTVGSGLATETTLQTTNTTLTTSNTNTGNAATSLSVMDDWDESDRCKVNPIVGQTGLQGGSGTVSNNTQRVVLATDVALPAGENQLGKVSGNTNLVTSTVTMSVAGAYSTGDYIGTTTSPQAFSNALRVSTGTGVIKHIRITDKITTTAVSMELWLFTTTFTAPTDNAAWAISDAENLTVLGVIPIDSSKWYASSNNKIYSDDTIFIPITSSNRDIYYALVARGTTPTWTSGDLTIGLGILQD